MTRTIRSASTMLVMIFAMAVIALRATAVEAADVRGAQAEVQIGLCSPADQIVQALDLRPRGAPIEVWQFDDAALVLFAHGLRLRLRRAADGRSEFTLKVADQDCAAAKPELIPSGEGKCEYDVYGTSRAGAVSLTRKLDGKSTNDLLAAAWRRRRRSVRRRSGTCAKSSESGRCPSAFTRWVRCKSGHTEPRARFTTSMSHNFLAASDCRDLAQSAAD